MHTEQQEPIRNGNPPVAEIVLGKIRDRVAVGLERYGTCLQPFNGRNSLRDLEEELIDGMFYLTQHKFELDVLRESLYAMKGILKEADVDSLYSLQHAQELISNIMKTLFDTQPSLFK